LIHQYCPIVVRMIVWTVAVSRMQPSSTAKVSTGRPAVSAPGSDLLDQVGRRLGHARSLL
jgi:hypothetical protein